ncbi:hypothetical protein [Synechococcus phage S-8S29]|nr:hypothetical protein [Synechococcus phage S-8S29]
MTLERAQAGEIDFSCAVYRDGVRLENSDGKWDLKEFVKTFEIFELISSSTIEAQMVIEDAAGFIGSLTGSEVFKLQIRSSIIDRNFFMRSYEIHSRSRTNQNSDIYMVSLASNEFIRNEVTNVFGNSEKIFKNTESSEIVKTMLTKSTYLGTKKKVFLEETVNKQLFVAPNWRVFDAIYWIAERSIRKAQKAGVYQNGFAFYENALGYHFKSIDKLIDDINDQSENTETNPNTGKPRLYTYSSSPKNIDAGTEDQYRISNIVFPSEKNYLMGLRHGAWSGYSMGFDPVTISESKMGLSTDMSVDAYRYDIGDLWSKMSHLKGGQDKNPITHMDKETQALTHYPKRVRYSIIPNQNFDAAYKQKKGKNYEQLVELQAYQWMRLESLKQIRLQITVPGNLDLYVGAGVEVIIPSTAKTGGETQTDRKYSGRYLIVGLTHKGDTTRMNTEMVLMKDSVI